MSKVRAEPKEERIEVPKCCQTRPLSRADARRLAELFRKALETDLATEARGKPAGGLMVAKKKQPQEELEELRPVLDPDEVEAAPLLFDECLNSGLVLPETETWKQLAEDLNFSDSRCLFQIVKTPGYLYSEVFECFGIENIFAIPFDNQRSLSGEESGPHLQAFLKRTRIFRFQNRAEEVYLALITPRIISEWFPYPFIEVMWDRGRMIKLGTQMSPFVAQEMWGELAMSLLGGLELLRSDLTIEEMRASFSFEVKKGAGRPSGSGNFNHEVSFLLALIDVLGSTEKEMSEPEALVKLSQHPLWKGKVFALAQAQKRTRSLRRWLKPFHLTWEEALKAFCSTKRGGQ